MAAGFFEDPPESGKAVEHFFFVNDLSELNDAGCPPNGVKLHWSKWVASDIPEE